MRIYEGTCTPMGLDWQVRVREASGLVRSLDPRLDLRNHSPDGFAWGYGGSGPAQLALALCADVLGDDARAQDAYQAFKWNVVAMLDAERPWAMSDSVILPMIEAIERRSKAA